VLRGREGGKRMTETQITLIKRQTPQRERRTGETGIKGTYFYC
jgi:hypothetical protein